MMSAICWRDSMMLGIGSCGSISQPLIHSGRSLLSRTMYDSGGAPSAVLVVSFAAWQVVHDRATKSRPAFALPRIVAACAWDITARNTITKANGRDDIGSASLCAQEVPLRRINFAMDISDAPGLLASNRGELAPLTGAEKFRNFP